MALFHPGTDSLVASRISKPTFFVLGAGRCGTTTLHSMLRQHPQIFMSTVKEPSFFCSYFQVVKDPVSYFQLFTPNAGQIAIGEASHVYLSNPESAAVIHALFPEARFILIFRSPTERAYSLYQWMRAAKLEPSPTFEQALEAEDRRYEDPDFFRTCRQYFWNYMYVRSSYFHLQWERYLRFYARERFFVLTLDELVADPGQWMRRIFEFLGVDGAFSAAIERLNAFSYPPIPAEARRRLDDHFAEAVSATDALAGRVLGLRQGT